MTQDLPNILYWWLMLFGLGILVFPLTKRLFSRFFDFGYPFAKILSILLLSYLIWLLGSLKILPFFRETVGLVIILLALLNFLIFQKAKKSLPKKGAAALKIGRIFVFEEILFLLALLFWCWVRAHEQSIHGLEKFMDYGFINSILKSRFFPPHDMWLAPSPDPRYTGGFSINYYYFGHLTAAVLTKLSGIDSAITYNLVLANIFALCFTGAFSIGANLIKSREHENTRTKKQNCFNVLMFSCFNEFKILIGGLLTAFLVTLAGNLHTIHVFKDPSHYWYPDATRFIPFTIHEFPMYSWVVADLHGHVFDIPFVLLAIAMLIALLLNSKFEALNSKKTSKTKERNKEITKLISLFRNFAISKLGFRILLLGLVLAVLYMTNAWDGIIYLGLSGLVLLVTHLLFNDKVAQATKVQSSKFKVQSFSSKSKKLLRFFNFEFLIVIFKFSFLIFNFFLFSLPFNLHFHPFVKGIGVNCPPSFLPEKWGPFIFEKANCQRSPLYMLAILWGFFFFNAAALVIFLLRKQATGEQLKDRVRRAIPVSSRSENLRWSRLSRFLSRLRKFSKSEVDQDDQLTAKSRPSVALETRYASLKIILANLNRPDLFILLMIFLSTLLLIFPEFFYAKDIYPAHFRANTMFKLGYQAFIMMSIASGYIIIRILKNIKYQISNIKITNKKSKRFLNFDVSFYILRFAFLILLIVQLFLVSIYPYYAIVSYYGKLKNYQGLDGIAWLKTQYADDYQAITWLKTIQLPATSYQLPVIAEAVGESYTDYARVSAHTGFPTILGWPVHEWLWRGSYDEPGARIPEVQTIYESKDLQETKSLLEKYNVSYIFLGALEREKYKDLNEEKFASLGEVVFENGGTKIFEID